MASQTITINKEDLYNLVREAVRDELNEIEDISNQEQLEIENLYGKSPKSKTINFDECVEL